MIPLPGGLRVLSLYGYGIIPIRKQKRVNPFLYGELHSFLYLRGQFADFSFALTHDISPPHMLLQQLARIVPNFRRAQLRLLLSPPNLTTVDAMPPPIPPVVGIV